MKSPKKLKAGSIIARGADTCVFMPRVKCRDKFKESEMRNRERSGLSYVSRFITSREEVDNEVQNMEYLKVRILQFQNESFWYNFLSDQFLLATQYCLAEFDVSDKIPAKDFQQCTSTVTEPIIFQTEKFDTTLANLIRPQKPVSVDLAFAQVILAFLKLNQNSEYLFVHNDLHAGNVGLENQMARINDFGRSFLWPVYDTLKGVDYTTQQDRMSVIRNMNSFFSAQYFRNDVNSVETYQYVQMIPEVRVIIQIAYLIPSNSEAKVFFAKNNMPLVSELYSLQNAQIGIQTSFFQSKSNEIRALEALYNLMTYVFRFSDLFGLALFIERHTNFSEVEPSNFLQEIDQLYKTKFQEQTLTENDFWRLICKYKLGTFLCQYTQSSQCGTLCNYNFQRLDLSPVVSGL